jgi:hypothetical protein
MPICKQCGNDFYFEEYPSHVKQGRGQYCSRQCSGAAHTAEKSNNWSGGRFATPKGYILVLAKDHPNANGRGYVFEHILVMEAFLGRYLLPDEEPHHKNRKKADNDITNLQLVTKEEHRALHRMFVDNPLNDKDLLTAELRQGLSLSAIGRKYGTNHVTVNNRIKLFGIQNEYQYRKVAMGECKKKV